MWRSENGKMRSGWIYNRVRVCAKDCICRARLFRVEECQMNRKVYRVFRAMFALFAIGVLPAFSQGSTTTTANVYIQHNLVSDIAGMADFTDSHLVNPWGISESTGS